MSTKQNTFEVLILDASGKSEITTVKSLVMAISYSEKLWQNAKIGTDESSIEDKALSIALQVTKVDTAGRTEGAAFLTRITSQNLERLEAFREKFFIHAIHKLGFTTARILSDTISESVSFAIYPLIKEVENALRNYLEKALIQKVGLDWWDSSVSDKVAKKVNDKKGNELFAGLVDNRMSLTDFEDLTELAYKTSLAEAGFKSKWEAISGLRNKVLGYSTFTSQEYSVAERLCSEVLNMLGASPAKLSDVSFARATKEPVPAASAPVVKEEKQAEPTKAVAQEPVIQEIAGRSSLEDARTPEPETPKATVVPAQEPIKAEEPVKKAEPSNHSGNFDFITENVMLEELRTAQSMEKNQYVDLKSFVTKTLGDKGYAHGPAYMVAKTMNEKGIVQIYDTKDERGILVKAIRMN